MEQMCLEFDLCPKYCHLQENVSSCNHFRISCKGVCREEEDIVEYNERVDRAVAFMKAGQENLLIREKGRNFDEYGFALLTEGNFKGYGFIPAEVVVEHLEDLEPYLIRQKDTPEARRYIYSHAVKYPDTAVDLTLQASETPEK